MKKSTKNILVIVCVLIVVLGLGWLINKGAKLIDSVETESTLVDSIPNEYLNLFAKKDSLISQKETHFIRKNLRYPISLFVYDNKYCITVTKIKILKILDQLPIIQLDQNDNKESYYGRYDGFSGCTSEINYREIQTTASYVYLHLKGDLISQTLKTNNSVEFYSMIESFSLKYKKEGKVDFYIEEK